MKVPINNKNIIIRNIGEVILLILSKSLFGLRLIQYTTPKNTVVYMNNARLFDVPAGK